MTLSSVRADPQWRPTASGELQSDSEVVPGLAIIWDPADPHRCAGLRVDAAQDAWQVADLLGLKLYRDRWLRLAALLAFDRLLHLSLNPSLLDGEIAVTQYRAARTLPAGDDIREQLVRDALGRARDAAPGVCRYLKRLTAAGQRPPRTLAEALECLVSGFRALSAEVREADAELSAVGEAWHGLTLIEADDEPPVVPAAVGRPVARASGGAALVDPRLVPARLFDVAATADTAEIETTAIEREGRPAVYIRVPAFGGSVAGSCPDIRVRLVDRRSGGVCSHGLLSGLVTGASRSPSETGDRYYEATVELPAAVALEELRVDLVDVAADRGRPPVADDELLRARRAALFLVEWRALTADARLCGEGAAPAARLCDLVGRLGAGSVGGPLWTGGPSAEVLRRLVDRGDQALNAVLVAGVDALGAAPAVQDTVTGPGDLLVAEIAAALDRSVA